MDSVPARPACSGRKIKGALLVDCQDCRQGQDLADRLCFKGVVRLMAAETPGIKEVTLSRDWQVVYGKDCVDVLFAMSEMIRFCNGLNFRLPFEDCASCPSNPRSVIARVTEALPRAAPELDTSFARQSGGHGRACEQCVGTLRSNLDHTRMMLDRAERIISKAAYRVVIIDDR
ncbi:MAG: hypothetical protein ISF22_07670 [Methanomassiliicoccus sp.]|nr:hypothetical protein [Methanomassiliicoccus sp.]